MNQYPIVKTLFGTDNEIKQFLGYVVRSTYCEMDNVYIIYFLHSKL